MNFHSPFCRIAAVLVLLHAGAGHAALQGRDLDGNAATFEAYYDTALDVTWLADWDHARTQYLASGGAQGFEDGRMSLYQWMTWSYGEPGQGLYGVLGWRLPHVAPLNGTDYAFGFSNNGSTDAGYARTGSGWGLNSEIGHLYYVTLDNLGQCAPDDSAPTSCLIQPGWNPVPNSGPFHNMAAIDGYWAYATGPGLEGYGAWKFDLVSGYQQIYSGNFSGHVALVHDGDIAAVPEPAAALLWLLGLPALACALRARAGATPRRHTRRKGNIKPSSTCRRWLIASGLLSTALAPAFGESILVDFDHRADGTVITQAPGSDLWTADTRSVLAGFGITVGALSHPDLLLRIGNHTNLLPLSPGNSFFGWAGGGTPAGMGVISYRLEFAMPVSQLQFVRTGLSVNTSSMAWQALAFDADGMELGRVAEGDASSGWDGKNWSARIFSLPYQDIAWLEVRSNFAPGLGTYLSPPLDDLRFEAAAVPEPESWVLMALGLLGLARRRTRPRAGAAA
jgi:hypothetical protein